jgi:hypothetical protein
MKNRRRVEIRVERHELSIYSLTAPAPVSPANPSAHPSRDPASGPAVEGKFGLGGPRRDQPEPCPYCGSEDTLRLAEAIATSALTANALQDGLKAGDYHLHCSRSGEWWVCGQSPPPG